MRWRNYIFWLGGLLWAAPSGADQRSAPLGDRNPTLATKQLLLHIADNSWPLERFVDKESGLIYIVVFGGDSDNPPPPRAVRWCGAELDKELATIKKELRQQIRSSAEDDNLVCRNRPQPQCTFNVASEWAATNTFWFRLDAVRGLYIEAYTQYPKFESEPTAKRTRRFVVTKLKALHATPCPKSSD
jgi:hypothetical protein